MERNCAIWGSRGNKTVIDENDDSQTELNNYFVCDFFNRNPYARQRRFAMIFILELDEFSTIFCCSLLLDLQKISLLITQEFILFSKC